MTWFLQPCKAQAAPYLGLWLSLEMETARRSPRVDYRLVYAVHPTWHHTLRFQVRFVQTYTRCIDQPRIRLFPPVDWPTDIRSA
jgi:hypothetical protein